jgi:hypothetical protein
MDTLTTQYTHSELREIESRARQLRADAFRDMIIALGRVFRNRTTSTINASINTRSA